MERSLDSPDSPHARGVSVGLLHNPARLWQGPLLDALLA